MKRFLTVLFFGVLLLSVSACGMVTSESRETFAMDTVMNFSAYGKGAEKALSDAVDLVNRLEDNYSVSRDSGEIARLNREGTALLTEETAALIRRCLEISDMTGGAFRPDLYELTSLWGFLGGENDVPADRDIEEMKKKLQLGSVILEGNLARLDSVKVDLGAAVKGYAGQLIVDLWKEEGISSGVLSLGGNVQTLGLKPDGSLWNVGIVDPENPGVTLCVLHVGETAVVTSGGYQRYFEKDGIRYCHIMDAETASPVSNDLASVTVLVNDGLLADCLSTALFVMGFDRAASFLAQVGNVDAVLVKTDGSIFVTPGLKDCINGAEFEVLPL